MTIKFNVHKEGRGHACQTSRIAGEAAGIYRGLRAQGFAVISYDEQQREYWMNSDGKLVHKEEATPPA